MYYVLRTLSKFHYICSRDAVLWGFIGSQPSNSFESYSRFRLQPSVVYDYDFYSFNCPFFSTPTPDSNFNCESPSKVLCVPMNLLKVVQRAYDVHETELRIGTVIFQRYCNEMCKCFSFLRVRLLWASWWFFYVYWQLHISDLGTVFYASFFAVWCIVYMYIRLG